MDCLFCKIVNEELPSFIVHEDEYVVAFLDKHPLSIGHTLIVPRMHSTGIMDIDEGSLTAVGLAAKVLAQHYQQTLHAEGFNLRHSSGAVAHQDVFHFHLHLIPRYSDDGLNLVAQHSQTAIDVSHVFEMITQR